MLLRHAGSVAVYRLLAVALPIVITVSFNSGAPHYMAHHHDAEPVEMCDWLSSCASPRWYDGDALPCTWRNDTEANATDTEEDSHNTTAALPPSGHNATECPSIDTRAGPDALRIVGGLLYPIPAAVSTCCLVMGWFTCPSSSHFHRIGVVCTALASVCCLVLMVLYATRPVISGPGWDVAIRSPVTWVAVRTYFAFSTLLVFEFWGTCHDILKDATAANEHSVVFRVVWKSGYFLLHLPYLLCLGCVDVGLWAAPVAAAHRILSLREWGFAISSAAIHSVALAWHFHNAPNRVGIRRCSGIQKLLVLLIGPGSFAILTAVYFGTTPTDIPLTSFWLPLGNPDSLGFSSVISGMFMPVFLGFHEGRAWLGLKRTDLLTPRAEGTPDAADALEMEAASSSEAGCGSCSEEGEDAEQDDAEDEEVGGPEAGGSGAADSDPPDGMPLSLRLPTGDVVVVCVGENATLGGLRRRALRELLSAATGGRAARVHLSLGGAPLRGPADTPLHTLTLESECVVEVRAEAVPAPNPAADSAAQRDLLEAVRDGNAARVRDLVTEVSFFENTMVIPDDVLRTLLRKAGPTEACFLLLVLLRDGTRFPNLAHPSGVLRRRAVRACLAETAEPWELYRLQRCARRDLGFGVSLEEAALAYIRHSRGEHDSVSDTLTTTTTTSNIVTVNTVWHTLQSWGMGVRTVPPAARPAFVAEEPSLWLPCLSHSSHPFSATLLRLGMPLREVPHAVTALCVVCAYSAVCALCVAGVAYAHAAFQMVDDDSAWMTAVFVAVSGPFFLFDLLPEWVQLQLVRRIYRWWLRDTHQAPPRAAFG